MTRKRHVPPSRERYEKSHPTVTVRVTAELYEELQELRTTAGFSFGQVLRSGLDKAQLAVEKGLDGARREGYRQGLAKGCEVTRAKYSVDYYCSGCKRKHLTITQNNEKNAAARLMFEAGWRSPRCSSV